MRPVRACTSIELSALWSLARSLSAPCLAVCPREQSGDTQGLFPAVRPFQPSFGRLPILQSNPLALSVAPARPTAL
jgi:hypothetical protein